MPNASENPFRRAFWLGTADARIPALLRLALGALVLVDLGDRLRDFHAFYTAAGLAARRWSLFSLSDNPSVTLLLYLLGFPFALAFTAGYRSRLANFLTWAFVVSLGHRNPYITDGGDAVLCALLFWLMFTDAGAQLSLDVQLGRRPRLAEVPAAGLRFLQLQIAVVYLVSFAAKQGPAWWDGTAVLRVLSNGDWGRGLAATILERPGLCAALSFGTLVFEGAFAPLVFSPWRTGLTRALVLGSGLAFHLGIFLSLRVGIFSQVMPLSYVAFLLPRWLDRALPAAPAADGRVPPGGQAHRLLALACLFLAVLAGQLAAGLGRSLPRPLGPALAAVGLRQDWRMFAPDAPRLDVRWRAPGELEDGAAIELVPSRLPELGLHPGFFYSRWHRLRNTLIFQPPDLVSALGRYVCGRVNQEPRGPRLLRFTLIAVAHPDTGAPFTQLRLRQSCFR